MNPTSSLILKGQAQRLYHKHCVCYDFRRLSKQNKKYMTVTVYRQQGLGVGVRQQYTENNQ